MTYEKFVEEYLSKGFLRKQKASFLAVEKLINRSLKDLKAAKANLTIDEGIAARRNGVASSHFTLDVICEE